MWRSWFALTGIVGSLSPAGADALELTYVSHLRLHFPEIGLTEPSGLAVDSADNVFWIVSDETTTVFRLGANGDLGALTGRDGRLQDLEGVAIDAGNARLLLISERRASILAVSLRPPHRISEHPVAGMSAPAGLGAVVDDRDNGLEGIAVDPVSGTVFLVKEATPRLVITVAPDLDRVIAVRPLDSALSEVGYKGTDASGIAVDPLRDGLWIVSDTAKAVHFLPRDGGAIVTLDLVWVDDGRSRRVDNAEGIAVSLDGSSLFVLSDDGKDSKLVHYSVIGEH